MSRKLFAPIALCAALVCVPAWADGRRHEGYRGHDGGHHRGYRQEVVYRPVYRVPARTVVRYYAAPPVYYAPPPVYYAPPPVYVQRPYYSNPAAVWIGGAIALGVILDHVDHHH